MSQTISQQKVNAIIKTFIKKLADDHINVQSVFLFGSYAKKTQSRNSDVDICIISPQFKDRLSASSLLNRKFYHEYNIKSDHTFDLIGYNPREFTLDSPLVSEIKASGKKIVL